jgi:hypothetical protein
MSDRMFQVIVLGGIGLVAQAACATSVDTRGGGGGGRDAAVDASDKLSDAGLDVVEEFPSEAPVFWEAGAPDATDAGFPNETK